MVEEVMTAIDTRYSWCALPGPELARVMLCGWQEGNDDVSGYWWYEEGQTDESGMAFHRPGASHWCPIIIPKFPDVRSI
jgi:hypothetical protein